MRFLANENFPLFSARLLISQGYEVSCISEDMPGAKDLEILQRAIAEKLVILTFDRDYGELIYRYNSPLPEGLIFFRFRPATPEEPAEILLRMIKEGSVSLAGKFTVVERGRIRQRNF